MYQSFIALAVVLLVGAMPAWASETESVDYDPNRRLQEFYNALPEQLQSRISDYRKKAIEVQADVEKYNDLPSSGLPPASFRTSQRRRMKIEAQMAALRLEQKEIAKEYYDLRSEGFTPPNNSNIVRLLVADTTRST
ncbi:MAG: hypothetical protein AAFX93_07805 [Verrucomicrobiota bacterium]